MIGLASATCSDQWRSQPLVGTGLYPKELPSTNLNADRFLRKPGAAVGRAVVLAARLNDGIAAAGTAGVRRAPADCLNDTSRTQAGDFVLAEAKGGENVVRVGAEVRPRT